MGSALLMLVALAVLLNFRMLGDRHRGILSKAIRPALVVGATGLALGLLVPLILSPEANEGRNLGIFVTGPLGLVAGLLYGIAREYRGRRTAR